MLKYGHKAFEQKNLEAIFYHAKKIEKDGFGQNKVKLYTERNKYNKRYSCPFSCRKDTLRILNHLAGRALNSDWSANNFIMVVHENFLAKFLCLKHD